MQLLSIILTTLLLGNLAGDFIGVCLGEGEGLREGCLNKASLSVDWFSAAFLITH